MGAGRRREEASGSGACAGFVAAARRGLTERRGDVRLDGGILSIEWLRDDHVTLTGPVAHSFSGVLDRDLLKADDAAAAR